MAVVRRIVRPQFFVTPVWTPANLPSLVAWYDASDAATITGSPVSAWNDKSGNGYHLSQGTGANRPTTGSVTQNGLNTLSGFNGSSISLTLTGGSFTPFNFLHQTASSIYVVAKLTSSPGSAAGLLGTAQANVTQRGLLFGAGFGSDNVYHLIVNGTTTVIDSKTGNWGTAAFQQVSAIGDPTNGTASARSAVYKNGSLQTQNNTASGTPSGSNSSTAFAVGQANAQFWTGQIAEIIITSALPTGTDRTDCESYLKAKWATP